MTMPEPDQNSSLLDRASGPVARPIFHIHPSLRCNLTCRHCYSESGPTNRTTLPIEIARQAITDAAAMGYQVLSVSGGEPFLYPSLVELLAHAKSLGLRTSVVTNGLFLQPRWLEPARGLIDTLAVSLDGPEEMHNRMRNSPEAFHRIVTGLETLRSFQMPFAIIHAVTGKSLPNLPWVAEFAAENGAHVLQLHPMELAGRAEHDLQPDAPTPEVLGHSYLLSFVLGAQYINKMTVSCDLIHREHFESNPEFIYASDTPRQPTSQAPLTPAEQLSLIVLEADGTVVPASYGFSRDYQICNVYNQPLAAAWPTFQRDTYPRFRQLCRTLYNDVITGQAPALFNWHDTIVTRSHTQQKLLTLA